MHKSNCRGASPPLLHFGLHAIAATPAHWLICAQVENVEIERMRLHMERDGKGEMNCWAALGMDAAAGEAAYADAQKSSDKQEQDLDPEAFEDDGKNEFKGMDKKEKKKAKESKREKEEAKHAGGVLGMFAVKRVCLRGHRYDIDAFMRKTKTTAKDVQSNIIKMQVFRPCPCATSRRVASMALRLATSRAFCPTGTPSTRHACYLTPSPRRHRRGSPSGFGGTRGDWSAVQGQSVPTSYASEGPASSAPAANARSSRSDALPPEMSWATAKPSLSEEWRR